MSTPSLKLIHTATCVGCWAPGVTRATDKHFAQGITDRPGFVCLDCTELAEIREAEMMSDHDLRERRITHGLPVDPLPIVVSAFGADHQRKDA